MTGIFIVAYGPVVFFILANLKIEVSLYIFPSIATFFP